jgi:hypothetical protein
MKLSSIFEQLSYGELSQLAIGGAETSGIVLSSDYPKLITHINLGLLELYKRFDLSRKEVFVQQYDEINLYYLDSRFAVTNTESPEPIKYIQDSVYRPFTDNVLRIEKVINECGSELYVNDDSKYWTVYTPDYNSIQVPWPDANNAMCITYRASPDVIPVVDVVPSEQEVNIPLSHLEPLLLYVASRIFASKPALNNESNSKGMEYMSKYELSCKRIEDLNLVQNNNTTNMKLQNAGWV